MDGDIPSYMRRPQYEGDDPRPTSKKELWVSNPDINMTEFDTKKHTLGVVCICLGGRSLCSLWCRYVLGFE